MRSSVGSIDRDFRGTIDRDARAVNDSVGETERGDDAIERNSANASVGTIGRVDANESSSM